MNSLDMADSHSAARSFPISLGFPQAQPAPHSVSDEPLKSYDNKLPPRYIIFNNMEESCEKHEDVMMIKETLDELGFFGHSFHSHTFRQMMEVLTSASYDEDQYSSLFVFILAYSNQRCNLVATTPADSFDFYSKMIDGMISRSGPGIVGIPKVFVVQWYKSVEYDEKEPAHDKDKDDKEIIPQFADLYFAFSSAPGKIKIEEENSSFIRTFCEVVAKEHGNYDFESLMTLVKRHRQGTGVTPIAVSTLRYLLHIRSRDSQQQQQLMDF